MASKRNAPRRPDAAQPIRQNGKMHIIIYILKSIGGERSMSAFCRQAKVSESENAPHPERAKQKAEKPNGQKSTSIPTPASLPRCDSASRSTERAMVYPT